MGKLAKDSMDELFEGLMGGSSEAVSEQEQEEHVTPPHPMPSVEEKKARRGRPALQVKKETACVQIDVELLEKVRAIAEKEGLSLTDLHNAGLRMLVRDYESRYGVVRVRQHKKKKSVDELFRL